MKRIDGGIPGVIILEPAVYSDRRGFFFESYRRSALAECGIDIDFVQDNHSGSAANVLRGLHYQLHRPQAKLIRVVRGSAFDVVVDVRRGSPWFGRSHCMFLSEANRRILFVPEGFAHGFYALSDRTEVMYKCSDYYSPNDERGVRWDDPALVIPWPLPAGTTPLLSEKDGDYRTVAEMHPDDFPVFGDDSQPARL